MARARSASEWGRSTTVLLTSLAVAAVATIVTAIWLLPDGLGPGATNLPPAQKALPSGLQPPAAGASSGGGSGAVHCADIGSSPCGQAFTISGGTDGLYPGNTAPLTLTLANPNSENIRVTEITVSVVGTTDPFCAASNLKTNDYDGSPLLVPANGTTSITLPITLLRRAPDACQGATFSLSYGGTAEQA